MKFWGKPWLGFGAGFASNRSYGTYPLFAGHVLSCPGAALNISCSTVPSILELLHWQFSILKGFQAAFQSRQVADMLATHLDDPLNIRFIPLSRSLLPERQKNYDFLMEGRVQYGFSHLNLEQQEIMNLQQSSSIDILYNKRDCHFRPQVADTAISLLVAQAVEEMRKPQASLCWSWRVGTPRPRTCMSKCWQPRH